MPLPRWPGSEFRAKTRSDWPHRIPSTTSPDVARRRLLAAFAGLPLVGWSDAFAAEAMIHMLVGYGAGGGADHIARLLADSLTEDGALTLVENRPGAAGQIALNEVVRAGPQRQTLLLGTVGSVSISPLLPGAGAAASAIPEAASRPGAGGAIETMARTTAGASATDATTARARATAGTGSGAAGANGDGARAQAGLQPIAVVASTPHVLLVGGDGGRFGSAEAIAALRARLAAARQRPGELAYASLGIHSSAHLVGELMCHEAGVTMTHIPYPGSARALIDLQGGHVAMLVSTLQASLPLMRQGRVRALAVTGRARSPLAPATPTFAEAGVDGMWQDAWYGVLAAPSVPQAQCAALSRRFQRLLLDAALQRRLGQDGAEPLGLTGARAIDYLDRQREVWRQAVALVSHRIA
ncbi:Bug family tripartite tricarboxylate transporter substrate binding protein [Cupriavidus plantarum]|uniref:Bug family tripartite tricarboxylate transporter substrate binding protein n=1 Tax=Cupriavidus plantarum TaxID=942865 RepID=UPI000EAF6E05|nr:tripartite tricarboxylate transporter substrate binding protein [Cupriavidus plantarum]